MSKPGKPLFKDPDETIEDILGSEACKQMSDEQKNIKLRDVMRSVDARFDHPDGKEGKTLGNDDWKVIIPAIVNRTGWIYKGRGAASCCCSWG